MSSLAFIAYIHTLASTSICMLLHCFDQFVLSCIEFFKKLLTPFIFFCRWTFVHISFYVTLTAMYTMNEHNRICVVGSFPPFFEKSTHLVRSLALTYVHNYLVITPLFRRRNNIFTMGGCCVSFSVYDLLIVPSLEPPTKDGVHPFEGGRRRFEGLVTELFRKH